MLFEQTIVWTACTCICVLAKLPCKHIYPYKTGTFCLGCSYVWWQFSVIARTPSRRRTGSAVSAHHFSFLPCFNLGESAHFLRYVPSRHCAYNPFRIWVMVERNNGVRSTCRFVKYVNEVTQKYQPALMSRSGSFLHVGRSAHVKNCGISAAVRDAQTFRCHGSKINFKVQ